VPKFLPSELPVRCRTRHHWIVLFRPPHLLSGVGLLVLLLAAVAWPEPMAWIFGLVAAAGAFLRWQTWQAEWVILTTKRVIRIQGVPETTKSEASLRVDRVSGVRLVETVPGKLLGYGTIELEAPGDHPGVRRMVKIDNAHEFYLALRRVVFGDPDRPDPDDNPRDFVTEPLPTLPERDRFGRRQHW
jgi:hypothetical protein